MQLRIQRTRKLGERPMSIRLTNNTRAAARAIKEKVKELELEWELNFSYQRATDPKAKNVDAWQTRRLEVRQQLAGLKEILDTHLENDQ